MIHALIVGLALYLGGLLATALIMAIGSSRDKDRPGLYDLAFLGCGVLLWPLTLPVALSVMVGIWGPREVDLDDESVDL
jgi:hypothetical protein